MPQDWISITYGALLGAWEGFIAFVPTLIGAIIVFVVGWLISVAVGRVIATILHRMQFNKLFEHAHWQEAMKKAELQTDPSEFIGAIFKWVLVVVFLLVAVQILGVQGFNEFLNDVLRWLPNVVVAVAMFVVAAIGADILGKVTVAAVERAGVGYSKFAGKIVTTAIWVFAVLAILFQLDVARELVRTLFTGLMAGLALAFGLAFGLGGKDMAAEFMQNLRRHVRDNE